MYFRNWVEANILVVGDVLSDTGVCLTYDEICSKIGNSPSRQLEYNVVQAAVNAFLTKNQGNEILTIMNNDVPLFSGKRISTLKEFRNQLIEKRYSQPCCIAFWKHKFDIDIVKRNWILSIKATKEIRLQVLHWKLLHNIYPTNIMLHKMKVRQNSNCSYCRDVLDVIEHFFYDCPVVAKFWKYVEQYMLTHLDSSIKLNVTTVLFGITDSNINQLKVQKLNHILLIGKMSISIFKKTESHMPIEHIFENNIRIRFKHFFHQM